MADPIDVIDPDDPSIVWIAGRSECRAPRCIALLSDKTRRCNRPAAAGGWVCNSHGAAAPQVKAANARRLATIRGEKKLADWGYDPVDDPFAVMSDMAGRSVALVEAIATDLAEGKVTVANVEALGQAIERAHRQAKDLASTGFEAARLRLDQRRLALDVAVIRGVLRRRGLDADDPGVQSDVRAELLELRAAPEAE